MLESNLKAGNQSSDLAFADMEYGVSVTDACIDLDSTKALLVEANAMLSDKLKERIAD